MELLSEKSPSSQEAHDSPFCLRKQSHDNRKSTSFTSGRPAPLRTRAFLSSEETMKSGAGNMIPLVYYLLTCRKPGV